MSIWALRASVIGIFIAILFYLSDKLLPGHVSSFLSSFKNVLWPSSIWLLATEGIEKTARGYAFVLLSVLANGVIFAILGSLLWFLRKLLMGNNS